MSEDYLPHDDNTIDGDLDNDVELEDDVDLDNEIELKDDVVDGEDDVEMEEITSDEVDRVVAELERLIESTESENIQTYLEDAMNSIYYLIYDEADEDEEDGEVTEAA